MSLLRLLPALLSGLAVAAWFGAPVTAPRRREVRPPPAVPDWVLPTVAAAGVGCAVALFVGGPHGAVLGVGLGVGTALVVRRLETPATRRRRERLEAALPHAVDLLTACLAAGRAPGAAVELVAEVVERPLRDELELVATRLRLGTDPLSVWSTLAGHPQLGRLGRCLLRAAETGASVTEATARLAEDLRRDARSRVEARARAVGVKAALPLGACMLPAFVLVGVVPIVAGSLAGLLSR